MKKVSLILILALFYLGSNAQNTKQKQLRDTAMATPHNPPRHRHAENNANKPDTAKGKLNKEKNQGNVPQPPDK